MQERPRRRAPLIEPDGVEHLDVGPVFIHDDPSRLAVFDRIEDPFEHLAHDDRVAGVLAVAPVATEAVLEQRLFPLGRGPLRTVQPLGGRARGEVRAGAGHAGGARLKATFGDHLGDVPGRVVEDERLFLFQILVPAVDRVAQIGELVVIGRRTVDEGLDEMCLAIRNSVRVEFALPSHPPTRTALTLPGRRAMVGARSYACLIAVGRRALNRAGAGALGLGLGQG